MRKHPKPMSSTSPESTNQWKLQAFHNPHSISFRPSSQDPYPSPRLSSLPAKVKHTIPKDAVDHPHSLRTSRRDSYTPPHRGSRSVLPSSSHRSIYRTQSIAKAQTKYSVFEELVLEQLSFNLNDLKWYSPRGRSLAEGWGIQSEQDLKAKAHKFKMEISESFQKAEERGFTDKDNNPLYHRLRSAFISGDVRGLGREVRYAFVNSVVDLKFSNEELANQKRIADLRYPTEWFPATRAIQRTIHLHVGPTNSGKTYHALQKLEAANTGIYAGPLRLLAHEVYTRFNAKGKPCALVTGEERRFPENLNVVMNSCTVEMVPLNTKVDVAVIDEIQMMGDHDRGWAWTQAFLGVQAKEVHLCGELRTVPLIQELCAMLGEKLEVHRYERLSPLRTSGKHIGSVKNLQKGDAVIAFSRRGIHALKSEIERTTMKRCAVVYGSLPPETRVQQANLFNDPDNEYDFLVASDAIGMGLNLAIKRVIFESTAKSNGSGGFKVLENFEIKQIGGRAGRYKTVRDAVEGALNDGVEEEPAETPLQLAAPKPENENIGLVTAIEKFDLDIIRKGMDAEVEPLNAAGIFPPASVVSRFASYFPAGTPFSYVVLRLYELASVSPRFKLSGLKDQIDIADAIESCNMTVNDRQIFMAAPAPIRDPGMAAVVLEYARCVADHSGGELLDMKSLDLELLDIDIHSFFGGVNEYLRQIEGLHKALTLYLWLSYRFTGVFRSQALAFHTKSLVEAKIDECLNAVHWDSGTRLRKAKLREKQLAVEEERRLHREAEDQINEERGKHGVDMEVENEDHGSAALEGEESTGEESEEADISEDPSLDETKQVEQPSELSNQVNREHVSEASTSNDNEPPVDEVALQRVIGRSPLLVAQRNHESSGF